MLQIKNIYKEYKTGSLVQKALNNVSLNLRGNEFVAILGPSGSGKTTLLNIIGGLDRYDKGDLIINEISTKNYKDRDWDSYRNHTIGFVFQSYNLIPHQTILSNVELALTISGVSKNRRRRKAMRALEQVGLASHAHKKPNQLSGGQMQRVAIARALVNNPDILLADEPTGALDSETSVQVMELLKEVAKDRLVVMVTHNPELAEKYATRIVNLKDGVILNDTNPYIVGKEENNKPKHKNMGKTSMSFLTSLLLSFNNLKTKKGRTVLISFAGSIGIIGIALILSLSTGVNNYIKSIEEDTLSEYPIQIQSTGINISSMFVNEDNKDKENDNNIKVTSRITNMFSKMGSNDLKSLKNYLESEKSTISEYTKNIEYTYNVTPRIYSNSIEKLRQVNPDTSFSNLGIGSSNTSNSLMSSMMSTDVFYQIPSDTRLFENQYDIKAGKWPSEYNECVLILTPNGNISDFMLYALGLRDYEELNNIINKFLVGENVESTNFTESYSYEDMIGITFKLINNSDCYEYDNEYKIWKDKSDNTEYMKKIVENGEDLKIVGVVQAKDGVNVAMLKEGIGYTSALTNYIVEKSSESQIVKEQLASPEINVFTNKKFDDNEQNNSFDMNSLMEIDSNAMKSAFKIDNSKIKVDFGNLNNLMSKTSLPKLDVNNILNQLDFSVSNEEIKNLINDILNGYENYLKQHHPEMNINNISKELSKYLQSKEIRDLIQKEIEDAIKENGTATITEEQLQKIMAKVLKKMEEYIKQNNLIDVSKLEGYLTEYLKSEEVKKIINNNLTKIIQSQNLEKQINNIMKNYMQSVVKQLSKSMEKEMTKSIANLSKSMSNAISIDEKAFANAFEMKMGEEELTELLTTIMSKEKNTYETNLKKLNYAKFEEPDSISIYPKDFEGNEKITNLLSDYNNKMQESGEEDKVISYTDMVGTLMNSVTIIIDVVSYTLIAFVSISLVVSSIMIGVITYISVLERKKEIGILRAMGASKHNVAQVFNAETFIIGLFAGVIGIGITILLLIPTNKIIYTVSKGANVKAVLPVIGGVALIALSTILTLIGGIIPSRKAAKEDPVLALRSE